MNTIKKIQVDGVDYDIQSNELTKVTYTELKEMRDNGSLAAGHLYRITDYEFTTKQPDTKSAGNVFDIIVLATAENQLSHIARAIQHEGDAYFNGNDLGAWELWYDLDNDATKYAWADITNGKGVIYRMIDEKRNDCPYDFKNALFYTTKVATNTTTDRYYYTFSYVVSDKLYDGSVNAQIKNCNRNSISEFRSSSNSSKITLNKNVFRCTTFGNNCHSNTFGYNCHDNTFGYNCHSNTFGNDCYSNTFGYSCYYNTFGNKCYSNTFRDLFYYNTFGNACYYNTFGNDCYYNTFGNDCYYNTFGYNCHSNTFGNDCYDNTFGNKCCSNTFGNSVEQRRVNKNNTSITLNDEYFDDGSGQLVPIKHPDLSTQPSILPYKFMGQYVYEQLIPNASEILVLHENDLIGRNQVFLDAQIIGPRGCAVCTVRKKDGSNEFVVDPKTSDIPDSLSYTYYRIVYTSMPEEGGDCYGYNNY